MCEERGLTVRARRERPLLRAVLGREDEADAVEVVFEVDRRLDVSELDPCVDLAQHFELGIDLENSIVIQSASS